MKKLISFLVAMLFVMGTFATEWVAISKTKPAPAQVELTAGNPGNSTLEFNIGGFGYSEVETPNGLAWLIKAENATPLLEEGAPDLLKMTASLIIPDLARMEFEIVNAEYTDYQNVLIAPSKGNLTRDIDPAGVPYNFGAVYQANAFYPGDLAAFRDPYIMRDLRGQTLIVYPFQYNPVQKTLRVYHKLTVNVYQAGNDGINPFIRKSMPEKVDQQFNAIYKRHFINYGVAEYTPVEEQGNMLIISYGSFMTEMQDFVNWKKTIGIPVEMVNVATIGSSAAIKTYIANYYNTNGLTFVLLVGDAAQVPSSYASGDSDNNYTYIVGSDHYPDCFIGRFSAENTSHVQTMVQRTIEYEQYPTTGYDWYTKCIGVASDQGPGDDNEYDYQHIRNMQTDLLNYTYTWNYEHFDGSQGGHDLAGNPTPAQVAADINSGSSIILYCGHGSNTSWSSSGFSNTNVNALTNNGKLPFIWSVACVNGNFVPTTCFAEAWTRATNNGAPSGAIATLMSTINQSWNPPMEGQDEMVDILVESYANNIKRTFGGLSMNGCMKMNDTYGSGGWSMTDTWTCFGDPSVVVRTDVPTAMAVTHDPVVFLGSTQFTVNCNIEGALVCLTINNEIIGTGYVTGGTANISFAALGAPGMMKIAVTAYNHIPYITEIQITPANGPYLKYDSHVINDPSGNNNGQADFGEDITLDLSLENVGNDPAYNVNTILSTSDTYVNITDNSQAFGTVPAGSVVSQNDAFAITIEDFIPDMHVVTFDLAIDGDAKTTWNSGFSITLHAPVLEAGNISIDDVAGGNGNGMLDPGETANVSIAVTNTGSAASPACSATLTSTSQYITIIQGSSNPGVISAGGAANASFQISVDAATPIGTSVDLAFDAVAGSYTASDIFYQSVGLVVEDWETGDFSKFGWETGGGSPWTVVSASPYEGTYCARSGNIGDNQSTTLVIMMNVTTSGTISFYRKVSSESGYDYLRFYIDGSMQDQWSGTVAWGEVTFAVSPGMHTFQWTYFKDANTIGGSDCAWIDYIVFPPTGPMAPTAVPYFTNFDFAGALPEGWYNAVTDDMDWTPDAGGTPSSSTGPSGDHTTGSGYYVYTESSSPNYPSKVAQLVTPIFDLTNLIDAQATFWYHMYGTAMGSLHLDVFANGAWTNDVMTAISGNQGNTWLQKTVNLNAYAGQEIKLRFRGITGTNYTSDMAIDDFAIDGTVGNFIQLNLKAFLEGPFNGTEMYRFINTYGYLPENQPYNMAPFYYTGTETASPIPSTDIVDWVLVELRETSGPASSAGASTMIARKAGFILKDGTITQADGSSLMEFDLTVASDLYVVLWHRNHLGVMSNYPLQATGIVYSFDFTNGQDKVYGGLNAHKEVAPGIWAMAAGDGNCDNQVSTGDKIEIWVPQSGNSGYLQGDFNMNANVENGDKIDYWAPNAGMGSQVPN